MTLLFGAAAEIARPVVEAFGLAKSGKANGKGIVGYTVRRSLGSGDEGMAKSREPNGNGDLRVDD